MFNFCQEGLIGPSARNALSHYNDSLGHDNEAIEHGNRTRRRLVTHVEASLAHQGCREDPHAKEGIAHPTAAIAEGKENDAASATKGAG